MRSFSYNRGMAEEHEQGMEWAAEAARRSLCFRSRCGAVIVRGGETIGKGYNAPPKDNTALRTCLVEYGLPQRFKYDRTCCVHAEWRAIMDALRVNPEKMEGARLYFIRVDEKGEKKMAGRPYCTVCSRLALDSGIAEFVLWHKEGIRAYPTEEYHRLSSEYVEEK